LSHRLVMSPTAIAPTPRQDDAPAILVPSENLQPTIRPTTAATAGPAVSRRAGHPFAELLDRGQPVRILRKRGNALLWSREWGWLLTPATPAQSYRSGYICLEAAAAAHPDIQGAIARVFEACRY
jgi:hypothetical protein